MQPEQPQANLWVLTLVVTPAEKRKAVAHLVAGHGMSERRACRVIGCCLMAWPARMGSSGGWVGGPS